jgi:hypothetical protein
MLLYTTLGDLSILYDMKCYIVRNEVMIMKPLKSKVSITLDEEVITEIKKLAEIDDRSFSQYINLILKEHLNKNNKN